MRRLLVATLAVALAACSSPGPTPSLAPGGTSGPTTAASTAGPSVEPSLAAPSASPPASSAPTAAPLPVSLQVFPPGAAVEVVVRELNVRKKPSTSSKRLEILERGDVMIISPTHLSVGWGPMKADGFTWYPVMRPDVFDTDLKLDPLPKLPIDVGPTEPFSGWIATDDGTQSYLVALPPRCPTTVDLLYVSGMLPAERLACFNEPFVLEGTYGCAGCGAFSLGTFKPAWLATPIELDFLSINPAERFGPLALRFAPDGPPRPALGSIIRVTVHVDDPRSTKCTITDVDGTGTRVEIDDRTAVLYCRERLVVDSYEVLGADPSFPPG